MPVINRFAELHPEITEWRRDFHRQPELQYDVHKTAGTVAAKLREFGCDEIVEGIGKTGVVGIIKGQSGGSGRVIGMRADMDALPINEETGKPWASQVPGKMHACGHDGHTSMLLGAAKYLTETRRFDGSVAVIFQPAEEGGAGGKAMVDDGLMERFNIQEVYGMHNYPGLPVGRFAIRPGPIMAAADLFTISIEGKGGHAARPHATFDPLLVGSQIVQALQSIVSRNVDPLKSAVVSVTTFQAGDAFNIIPQRAELTGTARTLDPEVRDLIEARMGELVPKIADAYGARATLTYNRNYPVTVNHQEQTDKAIAIARDVAGKAHVDTDIAPLMGGEDFSFMLNARPGAFIFVGNGDSAGLHHPAYDFDDDVIPVGASYWGRLAETLMVV
jgi:hippurate hydrolase